ncbi:nucleotide exchange factor GrpE [Candidatus Nitrospira nitrificans]|uniref:Protein GrpE n=1 Tax=Candidatus Nitrospira nitrificans TaxID=1742973 RepID=A0A0S4LPQ5_9BACT|nr:nucleotide exchange factor GrpE [Candidatus Nitrospira nitrificans]CUS38937.1 Protein GrpE [Candidatus Nitrospira nitrificans]
MSDDQEQKKPNASTIDNLEAASPVMEAADSSVQDELAGKTEECNALNDRYLRLAAEFENYKRLIQRDQREQIRFGNEQILKELLPVVDNMERAIKSARTSGGDSALVQGVELTLKQLSGTLIKFGVQAIETAGREFDPSAHQAVSYGPSNDVPANSVLEEFQKGYRLHDRILRAAMVSVSSGPADPSEHDSTTH